MFQNLLAQAILSNKENKMTDQQKQQAPTLALIDALKELLTYQKEHIPEEMYTKYIDGITAYIRDSLEKLK